MMRAECLVRTSLPEHSWPVVIRQETMETDRNNDSGISPGRTSSETNSNSPNFTLNSSHSPDRRAATPSESPNKSHSELKIDPKHYQKSNELYNYYYAKNRPYSPPNFGYSRTNCSDDTPKKLVIDESNFSPNSELNNSRNDKMDTMSEKSMDYDCDKDYMNDSNEPAEDSLERLKNALEKSTALSGIFRSRMDDTDGQTDAENSQDSAKKEFQCPLCAYTTPYRHRYQEHLATHYPDKCTLCDFTGQNVQDLRIHLQDVHNISDIHELSDPQDNNSDYQDNDDTPGSKRGKSKSFKCKQCNYVTTTKHDFWEHSKGHIKAEKLLTCPKCPFVTEYKHHLEYHLRNHVGSKPFKCTKCSYSCVNKSMLNSHLKSHSNVYSYPCADCAYATKYCHSLKLHLRKYQHKPGMVLNADGSPNPLPIIDVYGTRRGPKQKPSKNNQTKEQQDKSLFIDIKVPSKEITTPNLPGGIVVPNGPQVSPKSPSSVYNLNNNDIKEDSHNGVSPQFLYCNLCEFHTPFPNLLTQHMYLHAAETNLAHMLKTNNNFPEQNVMSEYFQKAFMNHTAEQPAFVDTRPVSLLGLVSPNVLSPVSKPPGSPLDLSKQDNGESENEINVEKISEGTEILDAKKDNKEQSTTKHRRKGKAYKLERINERFDFSPEEDLYGKKDEEESFKIKVPEFKPASPKTEPLSPKTEETEIVDDKPVPDENQENQTKESYHCSYCDMTFGDDVLHTMHMRYHGYQDPFTCNSCGQYTPDKFSFFLHIARSSHS